MRQLYRVFELTEEGRLVHPRQLDNFGYRGTGFLYEYDTEEGALLAISEEEEDERKRDNPVSREFVVLPFVRTEVTK